MNREQVVQLFKNIKLSYEHFEVSSDKVEFWQDILKDQDHEQVMKRFRKYIKSNKFPPTIADLYEEPSDSKINNEHIAYMRRLRNGQLN